MKTVGFNCRENITEACPPLSAYDVSEVLKHWIKTKASAKLKHQETGEGLAAADYFAADFLPYASQCCLYWVEIYFHVIINWCH